MSANRRAYVALLSSLCSMLVATTMASAQEAEAAAARTGIFYETDPHVSAELVADLDAALLRDLAGIVGISALTISPVDFTEIQITLGCEQAAPGCLTSIAQSAQVEAIVVRRLSTSEQGDTQLELAYFDARGSADARRVDTSAAADQVATLKDAMPTLVRKLFGLAEPAPAPAAVEPQPAAATVSPAPVKSAPAAPAPARESAGISLFTWLSLGTGAAVLTTGAVLGLAANSGYDDFKQQRVATRQDAERANADLDAARNKGSVATVLMPVGGALLALGATLLVIDLSSDDDAPDHARARLLLQPVRGGGMLTLRGSLAGAAL